MPVDFTRLKIGESYSRPALASIWGYKGGQALQRGVVTPVGQRTIVLFITKKKRVERVQYQDDFDGETLVMEGETNHQNDERLALSLGRDEVHLFYRDFHRLEFTYYGQVYLAEAVLAEGPELSRFKFLIDKHLAAAEASLFTEMATHGDDDFIADEEGKRVVRQHVSYERSRKNRAKALEIHGNSCFACGFNFDAFYGSELARGYIEIHHVESISQVHGPVDPRTGLVPLCSNCHSMVHRTQGGVLSLESLMSRIGRIGVMNEMKDQGTDAV